MVNMSIPTWTGDVNSLEETASLHGGSFGSQGGTLLGSVGRQTASQQELEGMEWGLSTFCHSLPGRQIR
jgi:hypothetical protein